MGIRFDSRILNVCGWFNDCKVSGSWGCKTSLNLHPSTPMLGSWYEVLNVTGLVFNIHGAVHYGQTSPLWSQLWCFVQMHLCKLKAFSCNPSTQAILVQSVSNCTVMNFESNMLTITCRLWDAGLVFVFHILFFALQGLTFGWTCWVFDSWEVCQMSWVFSTCE